MPRNDPEYSKRYYEQHKDKAKEYAKRYYEAKKGDPEYKAKKAEYMRKRRKDPSIQLAIREERKKRWLKEKDTPEYREKKRTWANAAYHRLRESNRPIMDEFFGGGCSRCGETERSCLEAHHLNPEEKERNVSNMWRLAGQDAIRAELAKCVCVCSNCHRKIHAGVIE